MARSGPLQPSVFMTRSLARVLSISLAHSVALAFSDILIHLLGLILFWAAVHSRVLEFSFPMILSLFEIFFSGHESPIWDVAFP